ncbi:VWD domain-containing protein [Streptomyces sp. NBC_00210]|uniref:VWD domain-containing protein n=1 Tax=unclassified Streptomyces TaxID=2593676 RepID=UPI00324DC1DB
MTLTTVWHRLRRRAVVPAAAALAFTLAVAVATPAAAVVDVGDGLHGVYDGCIAKFTAAGKRDLVDQLDRSPNKFKFEKSPGTVSNPDWWTSERAANGQGTGGTTKWNPNDTTPLPGEDPDVHRDTCATLYHEMSHLADYDKGTNRRDTCRYMSAGNEVDTGITVAEVKATRKENEYRATQPGLLPRTKYGQGKPLPPEGTDCLDKPDPPPSQGGCGAGCAIGTGDPHLTTFDGLFYDFQSVGEFVLTRTSAREPGIRHLDIQGRLSPLPGLTTVSLFSAVAADVGGDRVGVYLEHSGAVLRVDGKAVVASSGVRALPHGGEIEQRGPDTVEIRWPDRSVLLVEAVGTSSLTVSIYLADARKAAVEGLFGNDDGRTDNDLVVHGGPTLGTTPAPEALHSTYADSWRVTQSQSLFDYKPGQTTGTFTDRTFPHETVVAADLPNRAAAEAICRSTNVTAARSLEACIVDVGLTGEIAFAAAAAATQKQLAAGTATELSVSQPGGEAELAFDGMSGQRVFVDVLSSNLPDQCDVLHLMDPSGTKVASGCIVDGKGFVDATALTATGRYRAVLAPADGATGQAVVRVITTVDQVGAISKGGPPVSAGVGRVGGESRFSFTATAGQKVFVDVPESTLPDTCNVFRLLDPANDVIAHGCVANGNGWIDAVTLPESGRYTILIDPADRTTGVSQLRLIDATDQVGTITVDGPEAVASIAQAGAASRFRFSGTAGQTFFVDVPVSTLPDQCDVLKLLGPGDEVLASGCVTNGKGGIDGTVLPTTGDYTLLVDPADRTTGAAHLRLHT